MVTSLIISFLDVVFRQGDPLSSYFFVLAAKVLTIAVRQNVDIKAFFVDGQETKLLQYADDMTEVLSAQALFNLLDSFRISSGLSIDWSKTEGLWIGSTRSNKTKQLGINWPNKPAIKRLGSFIRTIKSSFLRRPF